MKAEAAVGDETGIPPSVAPQSHKLGPAAATSCYNQGMLVNGDEDIQHRFRLTQTIEVFLGSG